MSTLNRIRRRTWQVLEVGSAEDHLSRSIDLMIMALVLGNVVCTILESVPAIMSVDLRFMRILRLIKLTR